MVISVLCHGVAGSTVVAGIWVQSPRVSRVVFGTEGLIIPGTSVGWGTRVCLLSPSLWTPISFVSTSPDACVFPPFAQHKTSGTFYLPSPTQLTSNAYYQCFDDISYHCNGVKAKPWDYPLTNRLCDGWYYAKIGFFQAVPGDLWPGASPPPPIGQSAI